MKNNYSYTFGKLKLGIYKALDEYSLNGTAVSSVSGLKADIENRFISALNMCMRRVLLSLPALISETNITFEEHDGGISAPLPDDFYKASGLFITGKGALTGFRQDSSGKRLICDAASEHDSARLEYFIKPAEFTAGTMEDEPVLLPDISVDALIYLTAAELCPAEYSELYSKLMYSYRSIALNCYNEDTNKKPRNSFFSVKRRGILKG